MLYGYWRQDLEEKMRVMLDAVRKEAWGEPDLSSNIYRASVTATAVLYDRAPIWRASDVAGDALLDAVDDSGRWSLMQRVQRDTIGIREMFARVDALRTSTGDLEIRQRPVHPDMVLATPDPECPERPIEIREARLRKGVWTWDVHSVVDGTIRIYNSDNSRDVSNDHGGVVELPQDPSGRPTLPWGVWHGARTGMLFDPFELLELVEGSLTCALYWTFFGHIMRNCSWPQRYGLNVRVAGGSLEGQAESAREGIVTDPASLVLFESIEESMGQPILSQFAAGADPGVISEALGIFERRVAAFAGISPESVQRVAGDPRSGFAIALNTEAKRESQRRYEPAFRPSDESFMRTTAIVANAAMGADVFPVDGYRVQYAGLPATVEERREEREHMMALLDKGLASPIYVYRVLHPDLDDEGAKRGLIADRIATMRLESEVRQIADAEGLAPTAEKQQALVGVVQISREIFSDPTMTPDMKRAALIAFGGLDEAAADRLISTLPKPELAIEVEDDPQPDASEEPDAPDSTPDSDDATEPPE
jgi:hypothetical protein